MSTKISKTRFKEILKNLLRKEIEEASTTVSAGGGTGTGIYYDTPKAFSGKGKKDGVPLDRRKQVASGSGYEPVEEAKFAVTIDLGLKVGDGKVIVDAGSKGSAITMVARVQPGVGKQVDKKIEGFASDAQRRAAFASGYKAKGKKKKKEGVNEGRYHDWRNDESLTPRQKIGRSIREVKNSLKQLSKMIDFNVRLKNELKVNSGSYWKTTHKALNNISERLVKLANKVGKLQ